MCTPAITENITVDGSIEMLGDWFDPQDKETMRRLLDAVVEAVVAFASLRGPGLRGYRDGHGALGVYCRGL